MGKKNAEFYDESQTFGEKSIDFHQNKVRYKKLKPL